MNDMTTNLPPESGGYQVTRFNALRHGVLSRYTVLPWEDESEYRALLSALVLEHTPQGPTEEHLVEELAGILWRKRRLRLAESAAHRRGLKHANSPYQETVQAALVHLDSEKQIERVVDAIRATLEETAQETRKLDEDEAMTTKALEILHTGKPKAYENALAVLHEDTRDWWKDYISSDPEILNEDEEEDEEPATPDAAGLLRFLDTKVLPWYVQHLKELENRPLIRAQAFGESLDPDKLERLARYEVHLDRKLERMPAMLSRLQELITSRAPLDPFGTRGEFGVLLTDPALEARGIILIILQDLVSVGRYSPTRVGM